MVHMVDAEDVPEEKISTTVYKPPFNKTANRSSDNGNTSYCKKYFNGDGTNMAILIFLYILQGVPIGFSMAVPIIMQERRISYVEQAQFSLVSWPYSLKLLWAPIVDSLYWTRFGRRKSWLIPVQYLLGILLLMISYNSDTLFGNETGTIKPNVNLLTITFFVANFLAATQDVAVDGWSISMLKKENVGHSSTCNGIGISLGAFLGYAVFITLVSPSFCNKWIRSVPQPNSIVSIPDYIKTWAIIFLISTTITAILKKDTDIGGKEDKRILRHIFRHYKLALDLLKLAPVKKLAVLFLTYRIGFASSDAVSPLKLVDNGVSRDKLALLSVPVIPFKIFLPILISKHLVGPRPMIVFMNAVPYRLTVDLFLCAMVYFTPRMIGNENTVTYYYILLLIIHVMAQVLIFAMSTSSTAFFANISDPRSGGTYMTLLNTLLNLGTAWPSTVSLWLVEKLTISSCSKTAQFICSVSGKTICGSQDDCSIFIDGYYVEMFVCTVIGMIWFYWGRKRMDYLQNLDQSKWRTSTKLFTSLVKV